MLTALGMAAALVMAPSPAQTINPTYGPIDCVYDRLTPAQRGRLDLENIDSDANERLMTPAFEACGERHNWPAQLYLVVIEHLTHRLAFERAEPALVRAGLKAGAIAEAWASLSDEDKDRAGRENGSETRHRLGASLGRFGLTSEAHFAAFRDFAEMKRMERAWMSVR